MSAPRVIVVGGGLAGISAALECAEAGAEVSLFEARPRLGGATWSTRRDGLDVDNGQHVFLRCCTAYRGFLRRLGVEHLVEIQPRLSIPVLAPGAGAAWIRRRRLPAPAHLAESLLRYRHVPFADRVRIARTARRLGRLDPQDPRTDALRLGEWLAAQGESEAAIDAFWDLLVRPTLNAPASEASLSLAAFVFREGLLGAADAGDVGYASVPLDRIHAEPAAVALQRLGVAVHVRARVEAIDAPAGGSPGVRAGGARLAADAVILAADHEAASGLLPAGCGVDAAALERLGRSPILNLHVVFDREVLPWPFAVGVRSPLQWIFDRTRAAGLARGQYLAVSLSAADAWLGRSREELARVFVPAFGELLPAARGARVLRFFATCERAATFAQVPGTARLRPGAATAHPGVFLAGAWTATGWPATMEGAVRSGHAAAQAALAAARSRALRAEAA